MILPRSILSFSYGAEGELLRVNTPDAGVRVDFGYAQSCGRRVLASVVRRRARSRSASTRR